ncbi:MAG: UbiD family decarboxylase [Desulfovibrio sp.]|nr:UbiD family decarboxylase [Desulfovibrio sp.]
MGYATLARCVKDLENIGQLRRITVELDPKLEIGCVQRRVFAAKGPALLFTRVKGTPFPMLGNLFGTRERLGYIFRDELPTIEKLFSLFGRDGGSLLRSPLRNVVRLVSLAYPLLHMLPRRMDASAAPVLKERCSLSDLPRCVSWPLDAGPFITLPIVYSEDPLHPGPARSNLGMYRIQLGGNEYGENELGLHYQIHRGLGVHHAHALAKGIPLPVHIYVGGPPALTLASVMPLPEGISELHFAGLLQGEGCALARTAGEQLPVLANADFCLRGTIGPVTKPEGPFGDHMGYYSMTHPFPVFQLSHITHRPNAIWPFTTVGRPPQEDTVFGDFIHEITGPLLPTVFQGIDEVNAVDCAGVHPLLLAIGHERYTPYEARRKPRELVTQALHLLGTSQTSLAKFLMICAREDAPGLSVRDLQAFLRHMLERTDFLRDLHFITETPCDTLDYTGSALNEGSKLVWTAAGDPRRTLARSLSRVPTLPDGFFDLRLAMPGVLVAGAPANTLERGVHDESVERLCEVLTGLPDRESFPLLVIVDDPDFAAASIENFLWVMCTRSDPAFDSYGVNARVHGKHWLCEAPFVLDARIKPHHAPVLEEDPDVVKRIEDLASHGGPLEGCF